MNLKHYKTIYLGCESDERADEHDTIIRFCIRTMYAHPPIMDKLCSVLWEAHYLTEYNILPNIKKYCVLIPDHGHRPIKKENKSNAFDTIEWFISNMHPPKGGAIFSIYEYENKEEHLESKWNCQVIWPLKEDLKWVGDGDYITLHDLEPNILNRGKGSHYLNHPIYETIVNIEDHARHEVKRIDYTMDEETMFRTLKHSKLHLAFHGATYFTAGMINIPTICYGWQAYNTFKNQWFKPDGSTQDVKMQQVSWNNGPCNAPTHVAQYDWETDSVIQAPQQYIIHVEDPNILRGYINGLLALKWLDREYVL